MNKKLNSLLLNDDLVPLWIKLLIILYWYDYYKKNYIPNKLLENRLKVNKRSIQRGLSTLKERGYIKIWQHGSKRYFKFNYIFNEKEKSLFDYDWLNERD